MTVTESSLLAILLGLGIFSVIVAIGWRSVQSRRILRMQGADGHETIIIASEDDEISSVVTTAAEATRPAPEFGRRDVEDGGAVNGDAEISEHDRLNRVVASTK